MNLIDIKYLIKIIKPFNLIIFLIFALTSCNHEKKENTTNDFHKEKEIVKKPKKKKIIYEDNKIYAYFPEEDKEIELIKKTDTTWSANINGSISMSNSWDGNKDYIDGERIYYYKNNKFLTYVSFGPRIRLDVFIMDSLLNPYYFFRFHILNEVKKDKKYKLVFVSYFNEGEEIAVDFKKNYYIKNYVNGFMELSSITERIIHQEKIPTNIKNEHFFENNINFWITIQKDRPNLSKGVFTNTYLEKLESDREINW